MSPVLGTKYTCPYVQSILADLLADVLPGPSTSRLVLISRAASPTSLSTRPRPTPTYPYVQNSLAELLADAHQAQVHLTCPYIQSSLADLLVNAAQVPTDLSVCGPGTPDLSLYPEHPRRPPCRRSPRPKYIPTGPYIQSSLADLLADALPGQVHPDLSLYPEQPRRPPYRRSPRPKYT
jgi:hypothetical protein